MVKKLRSFLDEIESVLPEKDKHVVVESRANHAITSAINIMKLIEDNFPEQEADDLCRRLVLAIKNHNPRKFESGIRKLRGK